MNPSTRISKKLCWILRHGAVKEGLALDINGYANVKDLLQNASFVSLSLEKLQQIVAEDCKQRYSLIESAEGWLIRCNQGHSLKMEIDMIKLIEIPMECFHGTFDKNLQKSINLNLKYSSARRIKSNE
jgi:2'-phosphotransferase